MSSEAVPAIYLDFSDLLLYFRHNRFPTGIQRVQIELFKASLNWKGSVPLRNCAFSQNAGFWVDVDRSRFLPVSELASMPGTRADPDWRVATSNFYPWLDSQEACGFPVGAVLFTAGPTWWIPDYMSMVRTAKASYGIRYVPLLYDFIPMLFPDLVDINVAPAFNRWIASVILHADLLTTISRCTRDDAVRTARRIGQLAHTPVVMPLDGEFGNKANIPQHRRLQTLDRFGLTSRGFVLFVGTLEARKNHHLVFQAWSRLIEQEGEDRVPTLLCVGKLGWGFDRARSVLDARPDLSEKVILLPGISDIELNALYGECLFTVYGTLYEGWGLPVTESLCFGKACLTADLSSLPEAGGRFADYYEAESVASFVEKARRLIFDHEYRASREALIASEFRPRRWSDVLTGLVDEVVAAFPERARAAPLASALEPGTIYALSLDPKMPKPDGVAARAEMLCNSYDWHPLESWGVWSKRRHANIVFQVPPLDHPERGDFVFYLKVHASREPVTLSARVATKMVGTFVLQENEERLLQLIEEISDLREMVDRFLPVTLQLEVDRMVEIANAAGEPRLLGIGVAFIAICQMHDIKSRLTVIEHCTMATNANGPHRR
jgi:glycosyltransferase involved in cell wall biosynthesis